MTQRKRRKAKRKQSIRHTGIAGLTEPFMIERRFRSVSEEQVGEIQHLWLFEMWTQKRIAKRFSISAGTVGVICRCIPLGFLKMAKQAQELREARYERLLIRGISEKDSKKVTAKKEKKAS